MSEYIYVGNIFGFSCADCEYNRHCYGGNLGNQYRFCQKSREKIESFDKLQQEIKELKKQVEKLEKAKSKLTTMFANGHDDKVLDDLLELGKILEVE